MAILFAATTSLLIGLELSLAYPPDFRAIIVYINIWLFFCQFGIYPFSTWMVGILLCFRLLFLKLHKISMDIVAGRFYSFV